MTTKSQERVLSEAEKIWEEIKDKEIHMFALPFSKVSDFCNLFPMDPTKCFVLTKVSSVLPALETALSDNFDCTAVDKYILVTRKVKNVF